MTLDGRLIFLTTSIIQYLTLLSQWMYHEDSRGKAGILNHQYQSVFTLEDNIVAPGDVSFLPCPMLKSREKAYTIQTGLPDCVTSSVKVFTDDCLVFSPILSRQDCEVFHEALADTAAREETYVHGMVFRTHVIHEEELVQGHLEFYGLKDQMLEIVDSTKYLSLLYNYCRIRNGPDILTTKNKPLCFATLGVT